MNGMRIELDNDAGGFEPGQMISGRAVWHEVDAPESVELRLFWYTRGKGTQDVRVIETLPFARLAAIDERPFQFQAPPAPYSFSGRLISLVWALELVIEPAALTERREITIAPRGKEVVLSRDSPG